MSLTLATRSETMSRALYTHFTHSLCVNFKGWDSFLCQGLFWYLQSISQAIQHYQLKKTLFKTFATCTLYLALQYRQTGGGQQTSICVCPFMYSCVSCLFRNRHALLVPENLPYYYDSRNINFMFLSKILVVVLKKSVASLITLCFNTKMQLGKEENTDTCLID